MFYNPRTTHATPLPKGFTLRNLLNQAQEFQRHGDWSSALAIYEQLLAEDPDNADLIHQIGIVYAQKRDFTHALEYFNQALLHQPRSAAFHNSKGNLFSLQGDQEAALHEYRQAIKADPRYAISYNNIGRCLYLQEKFIGAQKSYAQALELNPQFGDAYYNQGVLFLKTGDLIKAKENLDKALEFNSKNPAIYGQMAQICLQEAKFQEAINLLQQRLVMQPDHIESWHYLGMAHLALEQAEDAVHSFEKILELTHQHPECYEHLAIAYLKLGDQEKALTYFLRQLEIQPTANAAYNAGVLLIEKGRHRDAIEYLKHAVALDPLHLPAHLNLGVEYLKLQQQSLALHHYERAAAIKPDDPEIQHILMALTQNKTPDKAPAEYLQNLFNQYAGYYDKHLTESLRYRVPQQLHSAIYQEIQQEQPEWKILDLGCGTGLCGELFKEFSAQLIGIDIAPEMINVAKTKNIYDELRVADIEQALTDYRDLDLILAADVFTYIGELNNIFGLVRQALKPRGLFAFSVEKTDKSPFELQASIRYAHSRAYLESLITAHQFQMLRLEEIKLRMQKDIPVTGYLVILRSPSII
jgi:predicted TPR repeat methyltransferase